MPLERLDMSAGTQTAESFGNTRSKTRVSCQKPGKKYVGLAQPGRQGYDACMHGMCIHSFSDSEQNQEGGRSRIPDKYLDNITRRRTFPLYEDLTQIEPTFELFLQAINEDMRCGKGVEAAEIEHSSQALIVYAMELAAA